MPAANSIDVRVGSKVIELRQRRGLTVLALARLAGMNPAELESGERGLRRISAVEIFKLSQVLHVKPSNLYEAPDFEAIVGRSFRDPRWELDDNWPQAAATHS